MKPLLITSTALSAFCLQGCLTQQPIFDGKTSQQTSTPAQKYVDPYFPSSAQRTPAPTYTDYQTNLVRDSYPRSDISPAYSLSRTQAQSATTTAYAPAAPAYTPAATTNAAVNPYAAPAQPTIASSPSYPSSFGNNKTYYGNTVGTRSGYSAAPQNAANPYLAGRSSDPRLAAQPQQIVPPAQPQQIVPPARPQQIVPPAQPEISPVYANNAGDLRQNTQIQRAASQPTYPAANPYAVPPANPQPQQGNPYYVNRSAAQPYGSQFQQNAPDLVQRTDQANPYATDRPGDLRLNVPRHRAPQPAAPAQPVPTQQQYAAADPYTEAARTVQNANIQVAEQPTTGSDPYFKSYKTKEEVAGKQDLYSASLPADAPISAFANPQPVVAPAADPRYIPKAPTQQKPATGQDPYFTSYKTDPRLNETAANDTYIAQSQETAEGYDPYFPSHETDSQLTEPTPVNTPAYAEPQPRQYVAGGVGSLVMGLHTNLKPGAWLEDELQIVISDLNDPGNSKIINFEGDSRLVIEEAVSGAYSIRALTLGSYYMPMISTTFTIEPGQSTYIGNIVANIIAGNNEQYSSQVSVENHFDYTEEFVASNGDHTTTTNQLVELQPQASPNGTGKFEKRETAWYQSIFGNLFGG